MQTCITPSFIPLFTGDGDAIGCYVHPRLREAGVPAPILYCSHDDSGFDFIAESTLHFARMVSGVTDGSIRDRSQLVPGTLHDVVKRELERFDAPPIDGPDEEDRLCARLFDAQLKYDEPYAAVAVLLELERFYDRTREYAHRVHATARRVITEMRGMEELADKKVRELYDASGKEWLQ